MKKRAKKSGANTINGASSAKAETTGYEPVKSIEERWAEVSSLSEEDEEGEGRNEGDCE